MAKERKDQQLFNSVHNKLIDHKQNIEKFTKNENVIKSLDLISKFIDRLLD